VLKKQIQGRSRALIYLSEQKPLNNFLQNHYGIGDLQKYVHTLQRDIIRADAVAVSSNSKVKKIRTFKGFLINCYFPVQATINGKPIILHPPEGTFQFIYDFEQFVIPHDCIVVGIENPENFRHIEKQKYLFDDIKPLFVSRYPQNQSKDLIKWLQTIPNKYIHFGDFDLAGIGIYLNEYKKYLGERATFFVPENIEQLIEIYGNRDLFDKIKISFDKKKITEDKLMKLLEILYQHKKGLEQEILIHYKPI